METRQLKLDIYEESQTPQPLQLFYHSVTKKLFCDEDWSWVMDFIADSHAYTKMLNVLKTSKAMGPKYKFRVEIPKSVKHALELDRKNGNNFGRKQWRKNKYDV